MGGGPGVSHPRIAPSALKSEAWKSLWGATFAVERKIGGRFKPVAQFRDAAEASSYIDEAVGNGQGDLDDYEIVVIHRDSEDWLKWVIVGVVALVILVIILSIIFR